MSQDTLFEMGGLTVTSVEEKIRAEQIALGDTVEGRRKIFETRSIRQITLAYGLEDARAMAAWLKDVMRVTKTKNPSEAVMKLKVMWEKLHAAT